MSETQRERERERDVCIIWCMSTCVFSNETIQFMVKFVDNNYRTFQKERRAKGRHTSTDIL